MQGMKMRARLRSDGTAYFPGIDWDNGSKPILTWHEDKNYVVFKIPAGKHWVSITEGWQSHPGKYVVCEILDSTDPSPVPDDRQNRTQRTLMVIDLFEMPVSARGRTEI